MFVSVCNWLAVYIGILPNQDTKNKIVHTPETLWNRSTYLYFLLYKVSVVGRSIITSTQIVYIKNLYIPFQTRYSTYV